MTNKTKSNATRRLGINIMTIVALAVCLCITTYALVSSVLVKNNTFNTGIVDIELNGGEQIIGPGQDEADSKEGALYSVPLNTEPGMTITKRFYIENNSTCDIWYKLYFVLEKDTGNLADILDVRIYVEGNEKKADALTADAARSLTEIYSGSFKDLIKDEENKEVSAKEAKGKLIYDPNASDEEKKTYFVISFHFPENTGNESQNDYVKFILSADAVQAKNNPDAEF